MSRSASGRSRLALASVVVIRPCSNSAVARFASMSRSCAGPPPRRGPLVGVGMVVALLEESSSQQDCVSVPVNGSVLLVLDVRRVLLGAVGVHGAARVEPGRAVLERQTHRGQLRLDL